MEIIKARGIQLVLGATVLLLIALIGTCLSEIRPKEDESTLYKKLDKFPAWAEQTLLEVEDKPYAFICGVSVADLLEFRNTKCELEGLTEYHFTHKILPGCAQKIVSANGRHILHETNEGVYSFVHFYSRQRIRACEKKILPHYLTALEAISDKEKFIIEQIQVNPIGKGLPYSREEKMSSCVKLIRSLAEHLPKHEATSIGKHHEFIGYWNERAATCKEYVKSRCSTKLWFNESTQCKEVMELI